MSEEPYDQADTAYTHPTEETPTVVIGAGDPPPPERAGFRITDREEHWATITLGVGGIVVAVAVPQLWHDVPGYLAEAVGGLVVLLEVVAYRLRKAATP